MASNLENIKNKSSHNIQLCKSSFINQKLVTINKYIQNADQKQSRQRVS